MPTERYDKVFGGKKGSARKALDAMKQEYGEKKGTSIFYAKKNKAMKKK